MGAIPSFRHRCCCVVAVSLSIIGSVAVRASEDDGERRERVILMASGRVLTGFASRNAGGWLVEQANGRVHVPEDQVSVVASSLVDAYRKQRDSVVEPTPATHMTLAHWCISYRLYHEAQDELEKCLKLDPDHSAARKLLYRVEEHLNPPVSKPPAIVTPKTSDGFLVPEVESLGGLSNEAAVSFTQRIQPLLVNKCGNASCHGSTGKGESPTGFHLTPVRNGSNSSRVYTERNLAEILKYVDINEPSQSPLAMVPQGSHAGTSGIFHGSAGNSQLKMLRAWIKTVAAERQVEEEAIASRPTIAPKGRRPTKMASGDKGDTPALLGDDVADGAMPISPPSRRLNKVVTAHFNDEAAPQYRSAIEPAAGGGGRRSVSSETEPQNLPKDATKDARKDPDKPSDDSFDPDVFNRRFHSKRR